MRFLREKLKAGIELSILNEIRFYIKDLEKLTFSPRGKKVYLGREKPSRFDFKYAFRNLNNNVYNQIYTFFPLGLKTIIYTTTLNTTKTPRIKTKLTKN
jgi:hypothetical protein